MKNENNINNASSEQHSGAPRHEDSVLVPVLERWDTHRRHPLFSEPCEWVTGLTTEVGKVARQAEQLNFGYGGDEAKQELREALVKVAGLSLAWLDYLDNPVKFSVQGPGLLIRSIENNYAAPPGFKAREERQEEKQGEE